MVSMFATPAVAIPLIQKCVGGLSIIRDVQSPALEIISRNPFSPAFGMFAKECHSNNGSIEIGEYEPGKAGCTSVNRTMMAWSDGFEISTGTLRRYSQGEIIETVIAKSKYGVTDEKKATSNVCVSGLKSRINTTVCVQTSARTLQPMNRWDTSKELWYFVRRVGTASTVITIRRASVT